MDLLRKFFPSRNERYLSGTYKIVNFINELEPKMRGLTDGDLREKTDLFKKRYVSGEALDALLPEAFAVVREVARRCLNFRHFDVQLIGGLVLHEGKIAEMRTGEGKTLSATLPVYLNALSGKTVHVVTVNDYLAKRDAEWMAPIYQALGLTVGVNLANSSYPVKRAQYACDVVYGTNNEFGFDYLRNNMALMLEEQVQGELYYAIVDEVDSILIDEARTPLIISGPVEESSELYIKINQLIPTLTQQKIEEGPGDYSVDEKEKQVFLTEEGHETVEQWLVKEGLLSEGDSLYELSNLSLAHHLNASLKAHVLYRRDVDYMVRDNQVLIVDEHTGRTLIGRRWSDGLHQAIEAKEHVKIQAENQTLASITLQNYFRLYQKLSGMTGTADTEAYEFQQIYNLEVIVIPTNVTMIRQDNPDVVFLTKPEKFAAIVTEIKECRDRQQPVLVGTASIETSEYLSSLLNKENVPHQVLNAKFHEKEAEIIAEAGRPGMITIATNMAGRGTDIVLGGNYEAQVARLDNPTAETLQKLKEDWQQCHDQVITVGGLHIIGSERHEARRIDNQLRGRSGRQGDPGSSRFYLALEDDLMRIFASERVSQIMQRLGMTKDEPIVHPWVTKAIENAQRKVEGFNFDIRKSLLEYDDVANDQRKVIYQQRAEIMKSLDVSEMVKAIREDVLATLVQIYIPPQSMEEEWDIPGLEKHLENDLGLPVSLKKWLDEDPNLYEETLFHKILDRLVEIYTEKEAKIGESAMRQFEKTILLQVLDSEWKDHLANMDLLRQGIGLRGYAQKNPKQEYKREAFILFAKMLDQIKQEVIGILSTVQVRAEEEVKKAEAKRLQSREQKMQYEHANASALASAEVLPAEWSSAGGAPREPTEKVVLIRREEAKTGRNEACPCGSGKKFKHCHGSLS